MSHLDFGIDVIEFLPEALVYERGESKGLFDAYEPTDCLGISVEDGVVKYTRNGKAFYESKSCASFQYRGTAIFFV